METIEQTLQENRQGTPWSGSKNPRFNKLMAKYSQGGSIDEDTAYEHTQNVFNDLIGERVEQWVKANKGKLEKMPYMKAMELYSEHVDKIRAGIKKEFEPEATAYTQEYQRRAIAQEQAYDAESAHQQVVKRGKEAYASSEADQAVLADPSTLDPLASKPYELQQAQQRQDDLEAWKK